MKADFKVAISVPFAAGPQRGKPRADKQKAGDPQPSRPPRIAVLMALAIHMEQLLREGRVKDQAELAKLGGVTRARVTQIIALLGLAPEIQEELLFAKHPMAMSRWSVERNLRHICALIDWSNQRPMCLQAAAKVNDSH